MHLKPADIAELQERLQKARARKEKIDGIDLSNLNRLLAHTPEDMTARVEAGMVLSDFQHALGQGSQWLPLDPPGAERVTIGELIGSNLSGPRRYGFGTVRDYLIGMRMVLADGRLISGGGNVVKNVAGYDLCKLAVGSRNTLGILVEATFKLLPKPECERFARLEFDSLSSAETTIEKVAESNLAQAVFDLVHLAEGTGWVLLLGFAGPREEVEWASAQAAQFGKFLPAALEEEDRFWKDERPAASASVLPSSMARALAEIEPLECVARAGNGLIYYRGGKPWAKPAVPEFLWARMKEAFDPARILPELSL